MSESLLNHLGNMYDVLPSCDHFGEFTYKEWGELIGCAQREQR